MKQFKRSLLSVALASALQSVAAGAYAAEQAAADEAAEAAPAEGEQAAKKDGDEGAETRITVSGIRAGIERSIETKYGSDNIVEVISAEDIGKLPDMSIADAISRLPGITAQRTAGRAAQVNIRGMPDFFSTTLMNGREQVSVSMHRGAEYDQYPSELIGSVVLYKTPNADLIGQGLSGTVDLRTLMPLDFAERVVNINVRGEKNSKGELNPDYSDVGERFSLSYIDQFADGKVGLAIGVAHLGAVNQSQRWEAWGYPDLGQLYNAADPDNDRVGPGVDVSDLSVVMLGGGKVQASSGEFNRDGLMAVLELKPNDNIHSTLDLYYSEFESEEVLRFMETGLGWSGAELQNAVIRNGVIMEADFVGVRPVLRNDFNGWDDKMMSVGWKNEFRLNDALDLVVDISRSEAERDQLILETYSGLGHASDPDATDTVHVTLDPGTGLARYQYGENYADPANVVLTDPGGWNQDGFLKYLGTKDELNNFRTALKYTLESGWLSSVEVGFNYSEREKSRYSDEYFVNLNGGVDTRTLNDIAFGSVDLSFAGNTNSIAYNPLAGLPGQRVDGAVGSIYTTTSLHHRDVLNKNWTVNEEITTLFVQGEIDADWGVPVRGNFGFQYVDTDQSSTGFNLDTDAQNPTAQRGGDSYDEFLPSINVSFELVEDHLLRVGLARQMARPRLDDMRANQGVGICQVGVCGNSEVIWSGSGGNPQLKPWIADALDLTYEIYFGSRGYVALNAFHKELDTYIYNQTIENYDYGFIDTSTYPPGTEFPSTFVGRFTGPANGTGGELSGYEVAVSVPFDLFSTALEGFGIVANYASTDSEVEAEGPGSNVPLPGLSEVVHNVTLYYENYGFSARVSQRHRDDFRADVQGFGGDLGPRYIRSETITDFQTGYAFAEGSSLEGLSLLFQINNLTDEPYREYYPESNMPRFYSEYGKTYLLGAAYKF